MEVLDDKCLVSLPMPDGGIFFTTVGTIKRRAAIDFRKIAYRDRISIWWVYEMREKPSTNSQLANMMEMERKIDMHVVIGDWKFGD